MTNKFSTIATYVKDALIAAGIKYVYISPDEKIGQNFPAAIIIEGSKSYVAIPSHKFEINQQFSILLLSNKLTDRAKVMNDLEAVAINALLKDLSLGGNVHNILPVETIIGASSEAIDRLDFPGYSANASSREVVFSLLYEDCRSLS